MIKMVLVTLSLVTLMTSQTFALSYDANVTPTKLNGDMLWGTGNANGGWTVDQANGIELGLRTHVRMPTPQNVFNSNGDGTYSYNSGVISGKALWNFDFSVDLNQSLTSNWNMGNVSILLGYDTDPGAEDNITFFNPLLYPDNAGNGTTTLQNSQNFAWGYGNALLGPATWDFVLKVQDLNGNLLAKTDMSVLIDGGAPVAPVPEPGTMVLLGLGLGGLALYGKRRKN